MGYGVAAAAKNEFSGLTFTCTAEEALTGCIPDGDAFLRRQSLDGTNIGANIGYIILLAVGSRFVAYLALRCVHVMDVAPLACASAHDRAIHSATRQLLVHGAELPRAPGAAVGRC
jgi:hypothetical protein